jgi:MFS family permease
MKKYPYGARLRRAHPDARDGRAPDDGPAASADDARQRLEPRRFRLAIAFQNLLWGASVPSPGDRRPFWRGTRARGERALSAIGLLAMAVSVDAARLRIVRRPRHRLALSGTTFGVVLGVVAKVVPAEKRSVALGIASAGGSFGQFAMVPYGQALITGIGWHAALFVLAATVALIVPLSAGLAGRHGHAHASDQTASDAFGEAVSQRTFHYLFWSYFVCGVQTTFIGLHLPSYVQDKGMSAAVGMMALALIGFGNIFGSFGAGWLGARVSKKWILTWIYALRSLTIVLLLVAPKTPSRSMSSPSRWACCGSRRCRSPTRSSRRSSAEARVDARWASCSSVTRSAGSSAPGSAA